ncbi:DUF1127 domain-containing protein [Loktanella sp. S4079]|uniref:DUF1127 domain-containing protein n=1 Tax=Loktanella sp. S4079 TaxID=579483 RepID=UPI0005F9E40B|nr:DUF1127 domain-containing protein [Loktanella sp. S4079]KJZ19902.1 hypothetical protein TW80_03255 [Loktanella sp. S4079]
MAFFTDTVSAQPQPGILSKIGATIASAFSRIIEAQDRSDEVRRLNDMSDAQLAELGIKRNEIVRHVFRDVYGI